MSTHRSGNVILQSDSQVTHVLAEAGDLSVKPQKPTTIEPQLGTVAESAAACK